MEEFDSKGLACASQCLQTVVSKPNAENNACSASPRLKAWVPKPFDVIVVGAGPAGLVAAEKCAKAKLNVLLLDRKQEIGAPKRCAEGLSLNWFERLKLKPNKEWCVQEIYGAALYAPNGKKVEFKTKKLQGYILERKIFEKHLAIAAAKAGAKIKVKANVEEAKRENGKVIVTVNESGEQKQYLAPLIIAADGVDSRVARMLGLNTTNKLADIDSGYQYELTNISGYDENILHLFFGNEIAPRGYLWYFPKRNGTANVGIGIGGATEKSAKFFLDKFIASQPGLAKGSPIEMNAGVIPVGGFLESMVADNLLVCGDAAHHVDPVHGGGIGIAMEGAEIAAKTAIEATKKHDFSADFLKKYDAEWYKTRGNQLKKRLKARILLEKLSDADFDYLAESLDFNDVLEIGYGNLDTKAKLAFLAKKLIKRPGLIAILGKYLQS